MIWKKGMTPSMPLEGNVVGLANEANVEIAKAEESLKAAELCYAQGLYNSAANRAYYAMFQAAQVALEAAGLMRPGRSHAGLHAAFANELTRRRKQFASGLASDLTIVQELCHTADYRNHHLSARQALRALHKASEFVQAIIRSISHG
jgi:uncharacterized protein (UPF0332 family)